MIHNKSSSSVGYCSFFLVFRVQHMYVLCIICYTLYNIYYILLLFLRGRKGRGCLDFSLICFNFFFIEILRYLFITMQLVFSCLFHYLIPEYALVAYSVMLIFALSRLAFDSATFVVLCLHESLDNVVYFQQLLDRFRDDSLFISVT